MFFTMPLMNTSWPQATTSQTIALDILNPPRPAYAFPTIFSVQSSRDAFPDDNGVFKFPPPIWTRRPAAMRPYKNHTPIDLDEFIMSFASKLHLREAHPKRTPQSSQGQLRTLSQPWYMATVTIPPRARHPAFVCSSPSPRVSSSLPTVSDDVYPYPVISSPPEGLLARASKTADFAHLAISKPFTPQSRSSSVDSLSSIEEQSTCSRSSSFSFATPPSSPGSSEAHIFIAEYPFSQIQNDSEHLPIDVLIGESNHCWSFLKNRLSTSLDQSS